MYENSRLRREIGQYLGVMQSQGLSRRYVVQTRSVLLRFSSLCREFGINSVGRIGSATVVSFLQQYENCSAVYQRQNQCAVRRLLAHYKNPAMLDLKLRVQGSSRIHVDWLTPEETEAVFRMPMTRQQSLLIGAGLLQGLRRVETLRLSIKNAKEALRTSVLRVRAKGKERGIPLHSEFEPILKAFVEQLETKDEEAALLPVERSTADNYLKEFCQRFGRKFTFHTMRRTFGRNLWLLKVPLETISELLGHASTDMTRLYLGLNMTDMRRALSCYTVARECTIVPKLDR